jgi:hypothetical protein
MKAAVIGAAVAFMFISCSAKAQAPAFPGAEGFGRHATGGRGGRVIEVTTLNDFGTGTLRAAVNATGPRTVVFRVSGTIKLYSRLTIKNGDITIAGQTAPGGGICVRDYPVKVEADNVIIRFMRFRLGDSLRLADDALSGNSNVASMRRRIIIDHCSISWALDENSSFYDNADFTMQWCFITESLYRSYHPEGAHGYGGMWGGWRASFHHNLLAHNSSRNPRFNGSRYTLMPDSEVVDFRNNVIYNWGFNSAYGGEGGSQNMVANYFKYGPGTNTGVRSRILQPSDTAGNWHIAGNFVYGNPAVTADNWNGGVQGGYAAYQSAKRALVPFPYDTVTTQTPEEAFEAVLLHGGASLPARDGVDARIVDETRNGTATYGGLWGIGRGIIDSQDSIGGWPALAAAAAPPDSDHDGMPDDWETENGLDPADSADGAIVGPDGYSNFEVYLNAIAQVPTAAGEGGPIPGEFRLLAAYPNPFNPATRIVCTLPSRGAVRIEVADITGRRVATLANGMAGPGTLEFPFDGRGLSSGMYLCRLSAPSGSAAIKLMLMK